MKYGKLFYYGSSTLLFAMIWGMFATWSNWWAGLVMACGITALYYVTQKALKNTEIIEEDPNEQD